MTTELKEESSIRVIMLGLVAMLVLLVLAGITKALIVPTGVVVEIDTLFYSMFFAASLGVFSIAFISQGLSEDNNLIRIICFTFGFLCAISTLFGFDFVVVGLLTGVGAILIAELFVFAALGFAITATGIYLIRRA